MAKESPFIPDSWPDGAPLTGTRSSDGPNYWANPPLPPNESELYPAPAIAEPPPAAPHPLAWIPTLVEAPPVEEHALDEPAAEAPAINESAAVPVAIDEPPVNQPAVAERAVAEPIVAVTEPVVTRYAVDEPVAPAFTRVQRAPYRPPAPAIDLTREADAEREPEADDFREATTPVRGGLFARYTPPVLDPLPTDGSHQKKRRHRLRSRR